MNGNVLIAGGMSDGGPQSRAALYDVFSRTFTPTASMTRPHAYATSTLLPDGSVLIAGSSWSNTLVTPDVDLFDPNSTTFMGAASMVVPRSSHTATLLPDGEVLMAGGCTSAYGFQPSASAETYYPNVLAPGPVVYSVPDGALKQGAILHAGTSRPRTVLSRL
jgi:hypothetical protein